MHGTWSGDCYLAARARARSVRAHAGTTHTETRGPDAHSHCVVGRARATRVARWSGAERDTPYTHAPPQRTLGWSH
eukprot:6848670-Prymnesium_polylepis.1